MQVDPSKYWMVVGTMTGYICGWDLRFRLPFREWHTEDNSSVLRISTVSRLMSGYQSSVLVTSGPNYFHLLDLETGQIRCRFERKDPHIINDVSSINLSIPTTPRMSQAVDAIGTISPTVALTDIQGLLRSDDFTFQESDMQYRSGTPIRALVNPPETTYILTGGTDLKLRYWDFEQPSKSYIISLKEPQPKYRNYTRNNIIIFEEEPSSSVSPDEEFLSHPLGNPSIHHHDCITDIKCLEFPRPMFISSSRDGVIKIWQ